MKKIALFSTFDRSGGAATACLRLAEALAQNKQFSPQIISRDRTFEHPLLAGVPPSWWQRRKNLALQAIERLEIATHLRTQDALYQFSIASTGNGKISNMPAVQQADILHFHWFNQGFLSLKNVAQLAKARKPIVWTLHDMWAFTGGCHYAGTCRHFEHTCGQCPFLRRPSPHDLSAAHWQRKQKTYKAVPLLWHIVTCSRWLAQEAQKSTLLRDATITAIPNPIDTNLFSPPTHRHLLRQQLNLPTDKKLILFVAMKMSDPRKGFEYLRQALWQLHQSSNNYELLVLGTADDELLRSLPMRAHSSGKLNDATIIARYYAAADIFVIPSLEENLPNTIMEASACGIPSVGFEVGGIPEMIEAGKTGFLAPARNSQALAAAIQQVLETPDYETLSRQARQKAVNEYSYPIVAQQYENIYTKSLEQLPKQKEITD